VVPTQHWTNGNIKIRIDGKSIVQARPIIVWPIQFQLFEFDIEPINICVRPLDNCLADCLDISGLRVVRILDRYMAVIGRYSAAWDWLVRRTWVVVASRLVMFYRVLAIVVVYAVDVVSLYLGHHMSWAMKDNN
jgi:hypothetical protein